MLLTSCGATKRFSQCTHCECTHHVALIFGGTACIAYGLCGSGSKISSLVNTGIVQGFTKQRLFGISRLNWNWPNIGEANTCIADIAVIVQRNISRYASNSIVSHLARQLEICPTTSLSGSRNSNLREHFVG